VVSCRLVGLREYTGIQQQFSGVESL